ncbi:MAG: hypothetical protein KatS3mg090_0757 [Patescibacteria group bacterium]|nr:MAG: hypothetical protein KatS3mg090_0757 [Patescibacteria group bacterium]
MEQNFTALKINSQDHSYTNFQQTLETKMPPKPKIFKKLIISIVLIIALGIILFSGTIVTAGYTDINLPFLNNAQKSAIKVYLAKLPFTPKTKEMVVLSIISKAETVTSFDTNISSSVNLSNISQLGSLGAEFDSQNYFSFKNDTIYGQGKLKLNLRIIANNFVAEGEYVIIGSELYFKLTYLPIDKILQTLNTFSNSSEQIDAKIFQVLYNKIRNRWIAITPKTLESQASKELEKQGSKETFSLLYKDNLEILINDKYKNIKFTEGDNNYIFTAEFTGKDIINLIKQSLYEDGILLTENEKKQLEELESLFNKLTITIEANKDYYVTKVSTIINLNLNKEYLLKEIPEINNFLNQDTTKVDLAIASTFDNFNVEKNIEPPQATSLETILQEIQLDFLQSYQNNYYSPKNYTQNKINNYQTKEQLTNQIVASINNYYLENKKYPSSLYGINPEQAKSAIQSGIIYQTNSENTSYLIYYKNTNNKYYTLIKNGKIVSQNLSFEDIDQELKKENLNILGAFTHRIIDINNKNSN